MFNKQVKLVLVALLPLVVVGCGESQNPAQQYGKEVIDAKGRAERVRAQADLKALETAVQQYSIDKGRFPGELTELPLVRRQRINPDLYVYDPATGNIQLR